MEVSLIIWSMTSLTEKAPRPARIERQSDLKKAKVCPGIQTRPAQTESHCSTACATTAALFCMAHQLVEFKKE